MRLVPLFLLAVFVTGCSVNPVTGKRQLNFYSEEDEVELGREAHPSIVAQYGEMDDAEIQEYVNDIGQRLESRRPRARGRQRSRGRHPLRERHRRDGSAAPVPEVRTR